LGTPSGKLTAMSPKLALRRNPQGNRSRGRSRNSWRMTVDDEVSKAGYTWWQLERIA